MSVKSAPTMPGHVWRERSAPTPPPGYTAGPAPAWASVGAVPWQAVPAGWAPPRPEFGHPAGPGYPQARPGGPSSRTWVVLGVAAIVVVLVGLVGLIATAGHSDRPVAAGAHRPSAAEPSGPSSSTTPAPASPVAAEDLQGLLLDVGAINKIMGTHDLLVNPTLTTTRLYIDTTDKPECGGVWANANRAVYDGSGWTSVQTQYLREPADVSHEVFQSVISFPTAAGAADFVAKEAKAWPLCNGRSITTTTANQKPQTWWVATVGRQDGMLTAFTTREGARGWGCQHALTARNNVVVDVEACGFTVMQQGSAIATKVAAGIR
ncbi:sensor domain-containing protein [Mycobacterium sp. 050134]|uniref:sensor domain-containing protein n=1 Tax=Mycobacterium sp. 050134 TaxID=3096111 RepID=UPI002EDAE3DB